MITFLEEKHLYLNSKEEFYRSVTTVLDEFKPKKDWEKIKKNYAKKNKLSIEEVTKKWDDAKLKGQSRGTAYHKFRELDLVSNSSLSFQGRDLMVKPSYCIGGEKKSTDSLKLEDGIYPELIIWLDSAKIAGQADKVIVSNGAIHIQDYKTNKKIDREGWKNWEGIEEKLLYPLDHLGNCEFNIYSLQLSMYMYMLLQHNPKYEAGKMELLHVQFEQDIENPSEEIVTGVLPIEVPYRKREIRNIILNLKQRKNAA